MYSGLMPPAFSRAIITVTFFKPAPTRKDPLIGLCISGPSPAPAFNVFVSHDESIAIARAIVTLSRDLTHLNLISFIDGKRTLIPKVLALNGRASWVSTVKPLSSDSAGSASWDARPGIIPLVSTHLYKCPWSQCDVVEPSTRKEFQYGDLEIRRKCFQCHKSTPVKDWNCACGISWFRCEVHTTSNTEIISSRTKHVQAKLQAPTSLPCKRKVEDSTIDYDVLFSEDLSNERKWARNCDDPAGTITLGDIGSASRVPKLGAILSKRFGHLSAAMPR